MNQSFLQSADYQELKTYLNEELVNSPIKFKTDGKTNEMIAREVEARVMACDMIKKVFRRFETRLVKADKESWK